MMQVQEKQNLIINKLIENNWQIISCKFTNRCPIVAKNKFAEIEITTEECECHGGRMWITNNHTNNYYEISHNSYDESKGITDSSSELRYIIENEMMDYVNRFSTFVYKLVKINEYGKNYDGTQREDISYYSSMEALAERVTDGEDVKDIHVIDEVKHQYPNENIYCITKRIYKESKYSWEQNRIWFKHIRYERKDRNSEFNETNSYEMYVEIFNKK